MTSSKKPEKRGLVYMRALVQIPLGRLADRVGYVKFLMIAQLVACGVIATFIVSKSFPVVIVAQIALGISAA